MNIVSSRAMFNSFLLRGPVPACSSIPLEKSEARPMIFNELGKTGLGQFRQIISFTQGQIQPISCWTPYNSILSISYISHWINKLQLGQPKTIDENVLKVEDWQLVKATQTVPAVHRNNAT